MTDLPVSIGRMDEHARFRVTDRVYGRKKEIKDIRDAFRRVCRGKAETVLISGEPGIGKTTLVNESLKEAASEKGYFITGKFDQLKKNIPYAPFADAFGNLAKQLMTHSNKDLAWWKDRIIRSIDRNCAVVTGIIPELEYIIGEQAPVEALPPQEAENRFLTVFRDFINAFVWEDHPLVLFLDDLQWADHASVRLLKYLAQDTDLEHLLIVGAFRDNELDEEHPLRELVEEFRKEHIYKTWISLPPLKRNEAEKMTADLLSTQVEDVASLSQYLYIKSGGNPFSLRQFLSLIHDEGLLYFNRQEGCWQWDLEAIRGLQQGEDVAELILMKISKLPEDTRELIRLASCYGNRFDMETLAALWGESAGSTADALIPAIREGLVVRLEKESDDSPGTGWSEQAGRSEGADQPGRAEQPERAGQLEREEQPKREEQLEKAEKSGKPENPLNSEKNIIFRFIHDRVQQAVYSLVDEDEKKKKHIMIGTYLLENIPEGSVGENILPVMDHFNRGLELIRDPGEKIRLAKYNLMAGRKARASAAYDSALQYFRYASLLIPDDAWEKNYDLSFDLHLEYAQALYLCGETGEAEAMFDTVLGKSGTVLERADVYGLKMILYAGIGKFAESVNTGIQALKILGMEIPVRPSLPDFIRELFLYIWHMRNKKIEDLLDLPEMEDVKQRKICELLARLCCVAMASFPELYSFIIIKTGNYALRHGNNEVAHVGYLGYGITAGTVFGDYMAGERYADVCIRLTEKYGRSSSGCIIYFVVGSLIIHWTRHAAFTLDYLRKAVIAGTEAGNLVIVGYAHCLLLENQYIVGTSLEKLNEEIREKYEIMRKINHHNLMVNAAIYDTVVSALAGRKTGSLASGVEQLGKVELFHLARKDKSSLATYYCSRMQLYFLAGDHRSALSMSRKVRPLMGAITGFMIHAEYYFYDSLAITCAYKDLARTDRSYYMRVLKKNMRRLKKWAQSCRENFEHKYLLVCAQMAGLKNEKEKAISLYDQAIRSARESGYVQNEAIANELAAKYYLAQGLDKIAAAYLADALDGYMKWGARQKAKELQDRYPEFLHRANADRKKDRPDEKFSRILNIPGN
jgi:histidine kinase